MKIKTITAVTTLAVVIFLIFQLFALYFNSYETEYAYNYKAEDIISVTGLITRKETVLNKVSSGSINYNVSSGERVLKDSLIADLYDKNIDIKTAAEISQFTKQIELYKSAALNKDNHIIDTVKINQRLEENIISFTNNIINKKFLSADKNIDEYQKHLYEKQIVMGNVKDYDKKISDAEKKLKEYRIENSNKNSSVYAPVSGIFINQTDGYEKIITPDSVKNMLPSEFEKTIENMSEKKQEQNIGKIYNDFIWYYTFLTDEKNAKNFALDSEIKIRLLASEQEEINAEVFYISSSENGKVLITLRSNRQISNTNVFRKQNAEIILKTYSGLKVDKKAVRFVDGKMGVYIKMGPKVDFKEIESIYSKDNYIISKIDENNKKRLAVYDEIIIKGKRLEDGKIIE